jgi:hypothetical protein
VCVCVCVGGGEMDWKAMSRVQAGDGLQGSICSR